MSGKQGKMEPNKTIKAKVVVSIYNNTLAFSFLFIILSRLICSSSHAGKAGVELPISSVAP
jgi:hypothetical protein